MVDLAVPHDPIIIAAALDRRMGNGRDVGDFAVGDTGFARDGFAETWRLSYLARMKATIWHNPDCGTSRKTLAILQKTSGIEVEIVEYRKTPFSRAKLERILNDAGLTPREALRTRGSPAEDLGLIEGASADAILDAMVEHPILVERPFVETDKGVRLCRPQEKVLEIL